jgi:hypothetical protein
MLMAKKVYGLAILGSLLLADLSVSHALSGVRGKILRSPETAAQGSEIRVEVGLFNGSNLPKSVRAQLWLVRASEGATGLGGKEVMLRPEQRRNLIIPGRIGPDAPVGPARIALVIVDRGGRLIADTKPIEIVAGGSSTTSTSSSGRVAGSSPDSVNGSNIRSQGVYGPVAQH